MAVTLQQTDQLLNLVSQAGLYLILTGHPSRLDNSNFVVDTLSKRYGNNTNVILEVQNEPEYTTNGISGCATGALETQLYNTARANAPNMPLLMWTLGKPYNFNCGDWTIAGPSGGFYGMMNSNGLNSGIRYTNAVVSYHGYSLTSSQILNWVLNVVQATSNAQPPPANYPLITTEGNPNGAGICDGCAPFDTNYAHGLENLGVSWTDPFGYNAADPITIWWPKD